MHDGDIDYSRYTLLELEEALAGIKRDQYPKNHANLRAAYERLAGARAQAPEPELKPAGTTDVAAERDTDSIPWGRIRNSRAILGACGAVSFWWAYNLFVRADACPSGARLLSSAIRAICERFGHQVAAGIPVVLGLMMFACALLPRRSAES